MKTTEACRLLFPLEASWALYTVLSLGTSEPPNGEMVLVSMAWYTKNRNAATMAKRNSLIHRDKLRRIGLVWPAGGAADSSLEAEEEEKEEVELEEVKGVEGVEEGRLVTLLSFSV